MSTKVGKKHVKKRKEEFGKRTGGSVVDLERAKYGGYEVTFAKLSK